MTRVIDLSHPLTDGMPVYPGTPSPSFAESHTLDRDGFRERTLYCPSHTGTHIDAPAHILPDGQTLDTFPAAHFIGPAVRCDLRHLAGRAIEVADLEPVLKASPEGPAFVLLQTGWDRHWGTPAYFSGFPWLSPAAAGWLADRGIRGVGIDAISVDPVGDPHFAAHRALLGRGLVIVENLTGLDRLPPTPCLFMCLPLPLRAADGSPVRAVALPVPPGEAETTP